MDYSGAGATSAESVVHYVGGAEIRYAATSANGTGALQEVRRHIGNVLSIQSGSGSNYWLSRQILLTDRQGSTHQVLGAVSLQPVNEASPTSFDAWGRRRDAATWGDPVPWTANLESWLRASTTHGYTGHEMAESVGVIHMNGRLYDPYLGRFLQADPVVQSPGDGQNWNRYTYAFNNPLAYTDPTGNMSIGDVVRTAAAIVITYYAPYLAPYLGGSTAAAYVVGGFAAGAVQTGSLKGAVTGAVTAGVFYGIDYYYQTASWAGATAAENTFGSGLSYTGYAARALSHGAAGGVMAELQGGRFGHGFASAGVSAALSPAVEKIQSGPAQMVAAAVIGGATSKLAGGKFANGAVTAAFSYAFRAGRRAGEDEAIDQEMAAAAALDPKYAVAMNSEADDFRSIRTTEAWAAGKLTDDEYRELMCRGCSDPTLQTIAIAGTGAMLGAGAYRAIPAIVKGGQYVWQRTSFDGPDKGFLGYGNGRIFGIRWGGGKYGIRLDFHTLPGTGGTSVLHLNYGPPGRGEAGHLILDHHYWGIGN